MMKLLRKFPLAIVIVIIISIMGSMMIHFSTFWGPWVFSDSTGYIFCARNFIAGHGLGLFGPSGAFHPLDLQPPFYSLVLSFFGLFGADLVTTARWIDVIMFGLTILLVGVSLYTFTQSSWLSIIGSFLLFCMPVMVDVYSGAMSEPLFIFTGLAGISLILLFLRNNRYIVLLAAALFSGLSMFTRYPGLAFIITGIIGLLVFSQRSWKNKIVSVLIYGVVSSLPSIGWLTWLKLQSISPRSFYINANIWEQFTKFRLDVMEMFWSWLPFTSLLPRYNYNLAKNLFIILILLMLVLFSLTAWKMRKNNLIVFNSYNGLSFAGLMILFATAYMFVLGFSYFFSDPPNSVYRILLPVQIVVVIGFFLLLLFLIRAWPSVKWLNLIPIFLSIGISISYLHDSIEIVSQYHQNGSGYTSQYWRSSPTIHELEQLPPNIPIISNESALVLFYTGHPAYDISELLDREPQDITNRYGDDPNDPAQKAFRENGAALVLFNTSFWQFQQLYGDQTTSRLEYLIRGLLLYAQSSDGAIYFYPSTGLP
jgi:hypothetical protein